MTSKLKNDPQVLGTSTALLSSQGRYQSHESPLGTSRARNAINFFSYELLNARNKMKILPTSDVQEQISTFCQQSAAFCFQEIHHLNAIFTTRSTYDESRKICPRQAEATQMQAHQGTWATACSLHSQERRGPGRSHEVEKPPNQDFIGEGHHTQLSCVAWEWDP